MSDESKDEPRVPTPDQVMAMVSADGTIDFHHIKSNAFRTIHVDGAFGGVSPRGSLINMTLFNERWPVPTQITHAIDKDGAVGEELKERRATRRGVVRELEANLVFDVETAKRLVQWLLDKIQQAESALPREGRGQ